MKKSLPCEMKATTHTLFIGATLFIENFSTTQPTVSKYQKNVSEWLIALTFSSEMQYVRRCFGIPSGNLALGAW